MAAEEAEITPGIKRRPSSRDQLLSKAIKDASKSIANVFKKIFLTCAGPITHHKKSKGQKAKRHTIRKVPHVTPQNDHTPAVYALQLNLSQNSSLPQHISIPKRSTSPVIRIDKPTQPTIPTYTTPTDLVSALTSIPAIQESPRRQTKQSIEYSQPAAEPLLAGLEIPEIISSHGVLISRAESTAKPTLIELKKGHADGLDSARRSSEEEVGGSKPRSQGSISYTVPGSWPKSNPGSMG